MTAAALAASAAGFLIAITGPPGLIACVALIGADVATATAAGFARLAASISAGAAGADHGRGRGRARTWRAGGPLLVGAFGLVSLTARLGALAAALLLCAGPAAPRNTSAPRPLAGGP